MTAIDFPAFPTVGQLFKAPSGASYQWQTTPARWSAVDMDIGVAGVQAAMSAEDNLLANGGFDIWQKGTTGFSLVGLAAPIRTADRWQIYAGVGNTINAAFNPAPVDDARWGSIGVTRTVAGTGDSQLFQAIENVRTAQGQTVTISFDITASVVTSGLTVMLYQIFGTGAGSPSPAVTTWTSAPFSTTAGTWVRKTFQAMVGSIAGKTLGTDGTDQLRLYFIIPASAGLATWYFGNVDMRLGPTAPAQFLRRPIGEELTLCKRYFQVLAPVWVSGYHAAGNFLRETIPLPVQMRATPTATPNSINYGNTSGFVIASTTTTTITLNAQVTATGDGYANANVNLDAEL